MRQRFAYSHSQQGKMDFCPRAFRMQYEARVRTKKSPQFFAVGDAVEAATTKLILASQASPPVTDVAALKAMAVVEFDKVWDAKLEHGHDGKDIDWGKKTPPTIKAPLVNLMSQFADQVVGRDTGYIVEVFAMQTRIRLAIKDTPGWQGILDLMALVRFSTECLNCKDEVAERMRRVEAKEINPKTKKPWSYKQPPCTVCKMTMQVPDVQRAPALALLDMKTSASPWSWIAAKSDGQAKKYIWALRHDGVWEDSGLQAATGHAEPPRLAGYLVGPKTAAGGWKIHLNEISAFDCDEADDAFWAHHELVEGGRRPQRPGYGGGNCGWCDFKPACWAPLEAYKTLEGPGIIKKIG